MNDTTIISIPVEFYAHIKDGEVTKFVVSPLESAAGYFGQGSKVWDGPEISPEEFWPIIAHAISSEMPYTHALNLIEKLIEDSTTDSERGALTRTYQILKVERARIGANTTGKVAVLVNWEE